MARKWAAVRASAGAPAAPAPQVHAMDTQQPQGMSSLPAESDSLKRAREDQQSSNPDPTVLGQLQPPAPSTVDPPPAKKARKKRCDAGIKKGPRKKKGSVQPATDSTVSAPTNQNAPAPSSEGQAPKSTKTKSKDDHMDIHECQRQVQNFKKPRPVGRQPGSTQFNPPAATPNKAFRSLTGSFFSIARRVASMSREAHGIEVSASVCEVLRSNPSYVNDWVGDDGEALEPPAPRESAFVVSASPEQQADLHQHLDQVISSEGASVPGVLVVDGDPDGAMSTLMGALHVHGEGIRKRPGPKTQADTADDTESVSGGDEEAGVEDDSGGGQQRRVRHKPLAWSHVVRDLTRDTDRLIKSFGAMHERATVVEGWAPKRAPRPKDLASFDCGGVLAVTVAGLQRGPLTLLSVRGDRDLRTLHDSVAPQAEGVTVMRSHAEIQAARDSQGCSRCESVQSQAPTPVRRLGKGLDSWSP